MFVDLENDIVARLKEKVPSNVRVMTSAELASVTEGNQPTPAVHVIYRNYRVTENRPDGKAARIEQQWMLVVAVKNLREMTSGSAARSDAMELADIVAPSIMGWQPSAAAKPFKISNAPAAAQGQGHYYLPLVFTTETNVRAK
ncbi:MAG: hypothetical protein JKY50_09525 [Oleispira sp.]|nr:hypothetical protein [Oleispira sp.]